MTVRMYADRKGLPLERVRVSLVQEHVHADDLTACVGGGADCVRQFVREITVVGDLDDAQRQKLLEIADKCPVHRTLEAGRRGRHPPRSDRAAGPAVGSAPGQCEVEYPASRARTTERLISRSACSRPAQWAPSTLLPGSRSL